MAMNRGLIIDGWLPSPYSKGIVWWAGNAQPRTSQPPEEYPPSEQNPAKPRTICPSSPFVSENLRHSSTGSRRTNQGSRKGAAGRCCFQSLSQGFQRGGFGVLPVLYALPNPSHRAQPARPSTAPSQKRPVRTLAAGDQDFRPSGPSGRVACSSGRRLRQRTDRRHRRRWGLRDLDRRWRRGQAR